MDSKKSKAFVEAAYSVQDKAGIEDFYRQWADQYDEQMEAGLGYVSPETIAGRLAEHMSVKGAVVDLGCGTGLVARYLDSHGLSPIDGIDLSEEMLGVARQSGFYRNLIRGDLTGALPVEEGAYAAAICAGTFTHGHVGPAAFDEIQRIVQPSGLLAFTVHVDLWESAGFAGKLAEGVASGSLEELERTEGPFYLDGDNEGWFCVYRKR